MRDFAVACVRFIWQLYLLLLTTCLLRTPHSSAKHTHTHHHVLPAACCHLLHRSPETRQWIATLQAADSAFVSVQPISQTVTAVLAIQPAGQQQGAGVACSLSLLDQLGSDLRGVLQGTTAAVADVACVPSVPDPWASGMVSGLAGRGGEGGGWGGWRWHGVDVEGVGVGQPRGREKEGGSGYSCT